MTPTFKHLIEEITSQKAPGPSTTFKTAHIFYALELMAEKPVGRNRISRQLNVGEGAVRTIISRLKRAGLILTTKEGCSLTPRGLNVWKKFTEIFPIRAEIEKTEITKSEYNYAFLVKNSGHKIQSGIEQRDAAIMAGAKRAVIIVSRNGHLIIASVSDNLEREFPSATSQILSKIHPENNDVIIIVGAGIPQNAKQGAFAASWALLDGGKAAPAVPS
jgi:predicted transcriptional regulator